MSTRQQIIEELFPIYLEELEGDLKQLELLVSNQAKGETNSLFHKIIGSSKYFETNKIESLALEMKQYSNADFWEYITIQKEQLNIELNKLKSTSPKT